MLKARILYGAIMIAVAVAALVVDERFAPYYPLTALAVGLIVWLSAGELARLLAQLPLPVRPWVCQTGCLAIVLANWAPHVHDPESAATNIGPALVVYVAAALLTCVLAAWRFDGTGGLVLALVGHLFAFFYIGVLGSFLVQLRWLDKVGAAAFAFAVFTAKCCDIAAYFTGRQLGRTKLAPKLSPGKTVEGSLGGLIGGVAFACGFVAVAQATGTTWPSVVGLGGLAGAAAFGVIVSVIAQVGDLVESLIKRDCNSKDASNSIPGFGGLLDVIDSVLFSAPVAYWLLIGWRW